jgi:site-specific DNA-cytosine methylase
LLTPFKNTLLWNGKVMPMQPMSGRKLTYFNTFSGIGSGELALKNVFGDNSDCVGFSEIEPKSIMVYNQHFHGRVNYGDIRMIDTDMLPQFDLLFGGSPCSSFTRAGKRQAFADARGALFFEFVRILIDKNPRYFLYENVGSMKKSEQDMISYFLGCQPVMINSASLCAQKRCRLYWANFPIVAPATLEGHGTSLCDIIEPIGTVNYSFTVNNTTVKNTDLLALIAHIASTTVAPPFCFGLRRLDEYRKVHAAKYNQMEVIVREDGKANPVTPTVGYLQFIYDGYDLRRLTPLECERLQCLPDNYTAVLSSTTQRMKAIGTGLTVSVMQDIFQQLFQHIQKDCATTSQM